MQECIDEFDVEVDISDCTELYDYATCRRVSRPDGDKAWDKDMLHELGRINHVGDTDENLMMQIKHMDKAINDTGCLQKKADQKEASISSHEMMYHADFDAFETPGIILPRRTLPIYKPGEVVKGYVNLKLNKPVKADALTINFVGQGTVCIRIYHKYGYYDDIRHEKYVDETVKLWRKTGTDAGEDVAEDFSNLLSDRSPAPQVGEVIPPGSHRWPFEFRIPLHTSQSTPNLRPSSCNYCFIMYCFKAKIDSGKALGRGDVVTHKGIWVEKDHDIGEDPENFQSVFQQEELKTGFLIKSGSLVVKASLPRGGYVKGESISLTLEIENQTSGTIDKVTACIALKGKYRLSDRRCTCSQSINVKGVKKSMSNLSSGMCPKLEWELPWDFSESSVDSNLMPTGILDDCQLIDVRYDVIVKIKRSGLHRNLELQLPIYVGSRNSKAQ